MTDPQTDVHPLEQGNGKAPGTTSWSRSVTELGTEMRSYYGRPVIKPPVWKPEVPWYFFTGGLGGASSVLGQLARDRGNDRLADAALWISLGADAASPLLLIADLGRPERFHHMLRMFKVTSPMNIGSWILTLSGTASGVAAGAHLLRLRRLRNAAERVGALLGMPLASYTGVLLSDTAIPVWHEARFELPLVFAASGAASAGAAAAIAVPQAAAPARRIAVAGAAVENVAMQVMERRLGMLGEPYKEGAAARYNKLAKGLSLAGAAVLSLAGRHRRAAAAIGGGLLLAGEASLRWSIFKAGFQSARDPRYTVDPQRQRANRRGTRASSG